jgi:hypothetical protein
VYGHRVIDVPDGTSVKHDRTPFEDARQDPQRGEPDDQTKRWRMEVVERPLGNQRHTADEHAQRAERREDQAEHHFDEAERLRERSFHPPASPPADERNDLHLVTRIQRQVVLVRARQAAV